jgi:UDP-N-acetylmuramate-alanine ligase
MELDKLHKESFYVETDTELADLIAQIKVKHDTLVFVTMGAGDVYLKKELIINTE